MIILKHIVSVIEYQHIEDHLVKHTVYGAHYNFNVNERIIIDEIFVVYFEWYWCFIMNFNFISKFLSTLRLHLIEQVTLNFIPKEKKQTPTVQILLHQRVQKDCPFDKFEWRVNPLERTQCSKYITKETLQTPREVDCDTKQIHSGTMVSKYF